jgi:hypothetical protein
MMSERISVVEKQIRLSVQHADRLSRLARAKALSEDQIIEKALDILFSLTDLLDQHVERKGGRSCRKAHYNECGDNEEDARYDSWRELYGLSAR